MRVDDGIHEASNGFLFLTGGAHDVLEFLSGKRQPTPDSVAHFAANAARRQTFCTDRGIAFSTWVFPEKLYCLRHLVPELGPLRSVYQTFYQPSLSPEAASAVHYPVDVLDGRDACFMGTDTHYALRGDVAITTRIYETVAPGAGAAFRRELRAAPQVRRKVAGDLGAKYDPPRRETLHEVEPLRPYKVGGNGIVGNMGAMFLVESPDSDTDQTLLIFGDSFFRILLPYLAVRYRRIVFCRSPFFHAEVVSAVAPSVIFCGMAERYLSDCQLDAVRPHFLSIGLLRGRPSRPDGDYAELYGRFFDQSRLLQPAVL